MDLDLTRTRLGQDWDQFSHLDQEQNRTDWDQTGIRPGTDWDQTRTSLEPD